MQRNFRLSADVGSRQLERWTSTIQIDTEACLMAYKQKSKFKPQNKISQIDAEGNIRDSTSLSIAISESSAEYFKKIEEQQDTQGNSLLLKRTSSRLVLPKPYSVKDRISEFESAGLQSTTKPTRLLRRSEHSRSLKVTKRKSSVVIDPADTLRKYPAMRLQKTSVGHLIMGGSKKDLICILTDDTSSDLEYISEFLIVYHYFTTCSEILDQILECYKADQETSRRIEYILQKWISRYAEDFIKSKTVDKLQAVIDAINSTGLQKSFKEIILRYERELPFIKPRVQEDTHPALLFEASSEVIAQQLTLLEQQGFQKISVHELRNQQWTKPNASNIAPGIYYCIQHFNKISYWCATEIISRPNLKQRVSVLKRIIQIADDCCTLRNYNTALAIIGSLGFAAIKRLKRTWKCLSGKYVEMYQELTNIFDVESNYSRYKKLLLSHPPPLIPYIGLYLRDITFLELGNPDTIDYDVINYDKYRMLSSVLREFQTLQEIQYTFETHSNLLRLLKTHMITLDEDTLYEISLKLEPKGSALNSSNHLFRKKKK